MEDGQQRAERIRRVGSGRRNESDCGERQMVVVMCLAATRRLSACRRPDSQLGVETPPSDIQAQVQASDMCNSYLGLRVP